MYAIASRHFARNGAVRSGGATPSRAVAMKNLRAKYQRYKAQGYAVRWNHKKDAFVVEIKGAFHGSYALVEVK